MSPIDTAVGKNQCINDSIDLFGNNIEPDPIEKNQPSEKIIL
jgi:hypothetical protein